MTNRRMATRPRFRKTPETDLLFSHWLTFITGAMCGACVVMGVLL